MTDQPAFYGIFNKTPPPPPNGTRPAAPRMAFAGQATPYAAKALANECELVAQENEGKRNDTLNIAGFKLAQLVAAGHITEPDVRQALTAAARTAGLTDTEINKTLASSLGAGIKLPRAVPDYQDVPPATVFNPDMTDEDKAKVSAWIRERLPLLDWKVLWEQEDQEEWIVEPLLPARRLVAMYSAPKLGKSLLMLELAVGIARGTEVLGVVPDRPRRVLYVDFENDPRGDVRSRLQSMGVKPEQLDNLCYLSYPRLRKLDTRDGGQELLAVVAEYDCEVVVIDTISRAVGGEENENDTWLNFYRHTGMLIKAAGVSCIRLDHTGKDHDKGMRGGSAKYGDVDAVWKLSRVSEDTLRLDCTDNRMPVGEKTLALRREPLPLRHVVAAEGRLAADRDAADKVNRALDVGGYDDDVSVNVAQTYLKSIGQGMDRNKLAVIIRNRKGRAQVFHL